MFGVSMLECEFACLKTEYDRDLKTKMNDITDNRNSNKKHQEVTTTAAASTVAAAATDMWRQSQSQHEWSIWKAYAKMPVIPMWLVYIDKLN